MEDERRLDLYALAQIVKDRRLNREIYNSVIGALNVEFSEIDSVVEMSPEDQDYYNEEIRRFSEDQTYQGCAVEPNLDDLGLQCLDDIEEEEPEWLITGYLTKGTVALLCGDGGSGKGALWCHLVGCLTTGKKTMFERDIPFDVTREPCNCMFFSSEDSVAKQLKKRLRLSGADMKKVFFVDLKSPSFSKIKLDSPELALLVKAKKPALCVIDPLQSFLDSKTNMISRNDMRNSLNPLIALAEETNTVFLIVCHTNKSQGTSGRKRVSDSSDLWDLARTVFIAGKTKDKLFYCSHEKNNYGPLNDSILFTVSDGVAEYKGTSENHDADFQADFAAAVRSAPAKEEAKKLIVDILKEHNGQMPIGELDSLVKGAGVTNATLRRAKEDLRTEGLYKQLSPGYGKTKKQLAYLSSDDDGNQEAPSR